MSFSRWKLMAGVLGVSLGGLAAVAGQCPKNDKTARQVPDLPTKVEAPMIPVVPPAGTGPAAPMPPAPSLPTPSAPTVPQPAELPGLPPLPSKAPDSPPLLPAPADMVKKPELPSNIPTTLPVIPASASATSPPQSPPPGPDLPRPTTPPVIDLTPKSTSPPAPVRENTQIPADPLVRPVTPFPGNTPPVGDTSPPAPPLTFEAPTRPAAADAVGSVKAPSKYRILLRVGEGEPTFEVRSGDDLLLKVVCEKVDIKSPDKGHGPSAVTARGKVRFAGFGAEGTCQELSFLAGTGEVSMSGDVKIQVKDKLGRVESELSTASMKYKIDPSTLGGSLKP